MEQQVKFDQVIHCGCGMDVHQKTVVATIRRNDTDFETREFNTYTRSLKLLRDWCKSEGVTHIAMESTGIYWRPIYNIMEEDFEVILVNARHIKNVPGHKTDKKDSRWISKLLLSGLLKGSFIPPREIRELRDLVRYKKKIVAEISSEKNRVIKILEDCNLKLSSVFSDVSGASASKMINDIIEGNDDVEGLMKHIHGKVQASRTEIRQALEGTLTDHHRRMLKLVNMSIEGKEKIIRELDRQIGETVEKYAVEIDNLQTIPGVGKESAIRIISEIGIDMSRFPNENHLSSWAGTSPGSNESAGKKKSTRVIHGNKHLQTTLVECGWGATRKKDGYLKRKFASLVTRRGKKKALMAIGHKIIISVYFVLKDKTEYKEPLLNDDPKRKSKQIKNYIAKLKELGYDIDIKHVA
jgi:transposase